MLPKYSIIRMMVIFHICMLMLCTKFLVQKQKLWKKVKLSLYEQVDFFFAWLFLTHMTCEAWCYIL